MGHRGSAIERTVSQFRVLSYGGFRAECSALLAISEKRYDSRAKSEKRGIEQRRAKERGKGKRKREEILFMGRSNGGAGVPCIDSTSF